MRRNGKKLAITTAVLGGVVALSTFGTMALFTDTDSIGANTFSTGTIALTLDPTTALVSFDDMMPGDVVTNDLVVTNAGTESLRYAVSSLATNTDFKGLKDELDLEVKTIDVTTPTALLACDDFDGTALYSGDLDSSAGKILGDVAAGANGGDRVLATTSATETLCFRVTLPIGSGNLFQAAATTATFTFDSEQTDNN